MDRLARSQSRLLIESLVAAGLGYGSHLGLLGMPTPLLRPGSRSFARSAIHESGGSLDSMCRGKEQPQAPRGRGCAGSVRGVWLSTSSNTTPSTTLG